MLRASIFTLLLTGAAAIASAQPAGTNYDEAKVPNYTLPDPLTLNDGGRVKNAKQWETRRRPEVFTLLEREMFGRAPGRPDKMSFELTSIDTNAIGGKAIRKEVAIRVAGKSLNVLLYLPAEAARRPVPVFVGLNFSGNHAVNADPGIRLAQVWSADRQTKAVTARTAEEQSRAREAQRWQVEKILAHGYGLATVYYGDIEPDFDGMLRESVRASYLTAGESKFAADEWGAIAAWAWGLSRIADYLATDKQVDSKRLAVMGHSRLGKTALWAGATDQRFGIVISNDSGEGGAAISRRMFGETVQNLNTQFPHWFDANYSKYNAKVQEMPFDSHMLLALIAPRPLYIASAEEDKWADPKGEFLAGVAVTQVYELFGRKGISTNEMPAIHQPVGDYVRYHIRAGKHDVTEYDWEQFLAFADRWWKVKK
jgi:hypothetical protein